MDSRSSSDGPEGGTAGLSAQGFYRRLLDNLADGVYFVDLDRRITYWNKAAEAISGYSSDEVVGRCCSDNVLVHTGDDGCHLCLKGCPLLASIETGSNQWAEVFLKHKRGHRVPVAVRVSAMTNSKGETIGG